ncbi:MAG TPA: ATP-binding protein [Woeseiaceae bacterium]|nr:ATP-binding protein [Woeseiaceae bacterium]
MSTSKQAMKRYLRHHYFSVAQVAVGALLGILLLHPLTTVVFYAEFNDLLSTPANSLWAFVGSRLRSAAWHELVPMSLVFALIGVTFGLIFGAYSKALKAEQRNVRWLERELNANLPALVASGESERVEFKSTLRWDLREKRSNKALEKVIAKSIAGLMNHRGGSLVIGVDDTGTALGIESDCQTLKHKNTDGFERALMDLVRSTLGAHACTLIHCQFPRLADKQVCWLVIEQSATPIFIQDGKVARYFVRTGNSTRELDAREAHAHAAQRAANV